MDRIAAMTAFVRVVEAGTFTKAADTLDLPNATVTRLIQGLEQDLKVRLLHRTTRTVTVTPEGATYYERVVRLLSELTDIESSTRMSQGKPAGKVRIECAAGIASAVIVPALCEFCRDYPEVGVELSAGNRRADLVAEGVDCAIRAGVINEQLIVARQIGSFHFATCATPGFVQTHGAPKTLEDLRERPTVGMLSALHGRPLAFRFADKNSGVGSDLTLEHRLVLNDTNTYIAAGLAGLGIIQAPSYSVLPAIRSGQLVTLLDEWCTPSIPVHVLYAPNRYLSAKVRVFIDWVAALFGRHDHLRRS